MSKLLILMLLQVGTPAESAPLFPAVFQGNWAPNAKICKQGQVAFLSILPNSVRHAEIEPHEPSIPLISIKENNRIHDGDDILVRIESTRGRVGGGMRMVLSMELDRMFVEYLPSENEVLDESDDRRPSFFVRCSGEAEEQE